METERGNKDDRRKKETAGNIDYKKATIRNPNAKRRIFNDSYLIEMVNKNGTENLPSICNESRPRHQTRLLLCAKAQRFEDI